MMKGVYFLWVSILSLVITVLPVSVKAASDGSVYAALAMQSQWSTGYCVDVTITNNSANAVTSWQLVMDLDDTTVRNSWNVIFDGDVATNKTYNGTIAPASTQVFGFCGVADRLDINLGVSELNVEQQSALDPVVEPTQEPTAIPTVEPTQEPIAIPTGDPNDVQKKIVIIKADDIKAETDNWNTFFEINKAKGVKVSAGIINYSLSWNKSAYQQWLQDLDASGWVEFWNHGWDHQRWTEGDATITEFSGSGYAHQKQHFDDAQAYMYGVLGKQTLAFGAPYNAIDSDTVQVINEHPETQLIFGYYTPEGLNDAVVARMNLRGEHDGTGKPNFASFVAAYASEPDLTFSALQFHPNAFTADYFEQYGQIIDFLISEGWVFMLPSEYVDYRHSLQ